jgi:SAM-dependent methyltransferase
MPLAFYAVGADEVFWREHWGGHSTAELLAVAERSPLTRIIDGAVPARGRVLEAGCGLGQYVVWLRRTGRAALGVDFTAEPLARCRAEFPATPLATMDLRSLGLASGSVTAYVSLGVVEHDPAGPDAILREARRVLEPGGVLVLSVPYLNGVRRLGAPWIRRRQRRLRQQGGEFYQFAFSRAEAQGFIERHGFSVRLLTPYDPARLLRAVWRALPGRRHPVTGPGAGRANGAAASPRRAAIKRLLYSAPALALLGHMILLVAVKR